MIRKMIDQKTFRKKLRDNNKRYTERIADFLMEVVDGTYVCSQTTESVYFRETGAKDRIRISFHTSRGTIHPCHVNAGGSYDKLLYNLRRAVISARLGLDSFKKFKDHVEGKDIAELAGW
jgi:hypothetical protein